MIANMLPHKQFKTRIELPNLGKPEYLTLTRQMLIEYRQMEYEIYRQGIQSAEALFFGSDIDTQAYNDYVEHFGPAVLLPVRNSFSSEAQDRVAKFIREVLENWNGWLGAYILKNTAISSNLLRLITIFVEKTI